MAEGYRDAPPWDGHPRWECEECDFDSLVESVIQEHVAKFHGEEEPRQGLIVITDKDGRPKH